MAAAAQSEDELEREEVRDRIESLGAGYVPPGSRPEGYFDARVEAGDWSVSPAPGEDDPRDDRRPWL